MKKAWSPKWKGSTQPRKQRKFRHRAPLHVRHKFLSANLSRELRADMGKRSMPLRKGDEVMLMRGEGRGAKGEVARVDMKDSKVYVDGITVKKVDGSEVMRALEPSNLRATKLKMDDKMRQMALERAPKKEAKKVMPKEKQAKAEAKTEAKPKAPEKKPKPAAEKTELEKKMEM